MTPDIAPQDFLDNIITPALEALGKNNGPHQRILFGTAAQESGLRNVRQDGGPALGYFQMEPATHNSLWVNFIKYNENLVDALTGILDGTDPTPDQLLANPVYEAAMCAVKYLDCPGAIPSDLQGQAAYYKRYYNTAGGAANTNQYINNWNRFSPGVVFADSDAT